MASFIAYLRVSTQRQGQSGLGLDAHQAAVAEHVRSVNGALVETVIEVESGRNCDRPQLAAALANCKATGSILLVANLSRLSRSLRFVAELMESGVEFVAADMPSANRLTLQIIAAVNEDEARRIGQRTRDALQAAKLRGVVLGGYRGRAPTDGERALALEARRSVARGRALALAPILDEMRGAGAVTLAGMAQALNQRGVPSARGGVWTATGVRRVVMAA